MGGEAFDKVKDVAEDIGDKAGDTYEKAKDFVGDKIDDGKGEGDDVVAGATEKVAEAKDAAEGAAEQTRDTVEGQ
jgi:hypothetical protein